MRDAFRLAWPYLRRYRRGLLLGGAALIVKDLLGALIPLAMKRGIDSLTAGEPLAHLYWACASLLALSLTKGFFQYRMRVILVGISRDVEYDIRNDLFQRLVTLSWDFYARFRTGDIMARATNDLNAVRMMLGPAVMYLAETSLTFILALAIMLGADWRLTLWALLPAPLVSVVVVVFGRQIHTRFEKIQGIFSEISSRVQENLSGARVVRAYVQEQPELERFAELNETFVDQNLKLAKVSGLFMPLLEALIGLTFLLVLWVGGRKLLAGEITLGSFVMFNTYMGMLVWPMIAFGWVVNLMERGSASMARIREFLEQTPSISAPTAPKEIGGPGISIAFDDVRLAFDGRAALDGISLEIPAGTTVAIVGRTGSGKTLLVSLIARLFEPTAGAVRLNGVDLREADPEAVRRRLGFVPQETFLFSATLAENIALGVDGASTEAIEEAAAMAGLAPDIGSFPNGLQTAVGERGVTLSGGQKQRTAIARALIRNPEVLVLDDALSAVDTLTEERILTELRRFREGRTTILISHRVSTVRDADRIYVLDHGKLVEEGAHSELLGRGGYYAELHQKQMLEEELESI
jgi:ATP-binding cassette subfamily B protein